MSEARLQLAIRTPRELVLEIGVSSMRVSTETGEVGVRPRIEPLVLAVEPGLVLLRRDEALQFAGTAGGLLRCDGVNASLLTPLAVIGNDEMEVLTALDTALAQPNVELEARATLSRLQASILTELREGQRDNIRTLKGQP